MAIYIPAFCRTLTDIYSHEKRQEASMFFLSDELPGFAAPASSHGLFTNILIFMLANFSCRNTQLSTPSPPKQKQKRFYTIGHRKELCLSRGKGGTLPCHLDSQTMEVPPHKTVAPATKSFIVAFVGLPVCIHKPEQL